ncbi:alpha/beta fold hydrolase [Planktotalea sp.]|uniref:alpha/beta hydrolase n=1 Tax=Planktotalea sp. TaxID=2029877 RepID=UPI00329A4689
MLFATRRSFNATKNILTNNPSSVTRYLSIKSATEPPAKWRDGFYKREDWLRFVMQEASTNEVLIYVHGFNTTQAGNLRRLDKIKAGLKAQGYKGAVIGFDWPSSGNPLDYDGDLGRAKQTAQYLISELAIPLMFLPERPKVHLLAHSMGGYSVLKGLQDMGDSKGPGNWALDQVVFASADVHQPSMERGAWGALIMRHRSKRFTNYYSGDDNVLKLSKFINGTRKRVGRAGLPSPAFSTHIDVSCTAQFRRDETNLPDISFLSHRWWFESAPFYKDLALTLAGKDGFSSGTRLKGPGRDFTLNVS